MLSVHQKGAAEAFVWVNYKNGFKWQNRESSPWIASVGWTVCHSIKTIPRCFDKVCAYLSAGWLKESVCPCLMRACECCCAVESQNKFCQWADKEKCLCVLEQQTEQCGHISVWFGETFGGGNRSKLVTINCVAFLRLSCNFTGSFEPGHNFLHYII